MALDNNSKNKLIDVMEKHSVLTGRSDELKKITAAISDILKETKVASEILTKITQWLAREANNITQEYGNLEEAADEIRSLLDK